MYTPPIIYPPRPFLETSYTERIDEYSRRQVSDILITIHFHPPRDLSTTQWTCL